MLMSCSPYPHLASSVPQNIQAVSRGFVREFSESVSFRCDKAWTFWINVRHFGCTPSAECRVRRAECVCGVR